MADLLTVDRPAKPRHLALCAFVPFILSVRTSGPAAILAAAIAREHCR